MKKANVIEAILGDRILNAPQSLTAKSFAPTNIALCKYWGKRNQELNLPETSSLSISLAGKGTTTVIYVIDDNALLQCGVTHSSALPNQKRIENTFSVPQMAKPCDPTSSDHIGRTTRLLDAMSSDVIVFNGKQIDPTSSFSHRLHAFLSLFRKHHPSRFYIDITSNIPLAAGLASSASGFASFVLALNQLYKWELSLQALSILARLGSGSACRSLWEGFVEWERGCQVDGMDSYGQPIPYKWPELSIGLLLINTNEKRISSRDAMQRTKTTSSFYSLWPHKIRDDLSLIKEAIQKHDFSLLGKTAESNAMAMHAMMLSAWPPISYFQPETMAAMQQIWQLRQEGLEVYFTQDAGPNLKLLILQKDVEAVISAFPAIEILQPFSY